MPVEITESHLLYMNLGRRYWPSRLQTLTPEQKTSLGKYLETFGYSLKNGIGLFLWGNNSTGKTHTAAAFCISAVEDYRVTSYMIRAAELKEAWVRDYPANAGSSETVCERISSVRLLVIDDLGKEYRTSSGFAESSFGSLLRDRSRNKLCTFITTNMNPKEFTATYGPSSGELLKECMFPVKLPDARHRDSLAEKIFHFFTG